MIWFLLACRPDPGEPNYPEPGSLGTDTDAEFLEGPDPYVDGEERLSIGVFYEGPSTEFVEVDNVTVHFYIYEASFSVNDDTERAEGYLSDKFTLARDTWWGGGVHWDTPRDLSAYNSYHLSLLSQDAVEIDLGMKASTENKLKTSDYGFEADGEWHHLVIPLADFGVSLDAVEIPMILVSDTSSTGASFLVDNVYMDVE